MNCSFNLAIPDLMADGTTFLPLIIRRDDAPPLSDEALFDFCQANRELRIERTAQGELIIMSPTGSKSGHRNAQLIKQLCTWAQRDGRGMVFDSSAGFTLPNGAMRAPDASWVGMDRWNALSERDQNRFSPLCPDFVVDLLSPSDNLRETQDKLKEYLDNGTEMGLIVDPERRQLHCYRRGEEPQILDNPDTFACHPLLAGFVLELREIW